MHDAMASVPSLKRGWPGVKTMERKSQFPMTFVGKNLGRKSLILKRFSGVLVMVLSGLDAGDSEVSTGTVGGGINLGM